MVATPYCVLLVEDQRDQGAFLTNLLAACGYRTVVADGMSAALAAIGRRRPDVVMIDMMMPADQGIRLYRYLKANDKFQTLPVVMISSIDRRMFFQIHQIQEPHTKQGLPLPEAYIETPPEADELTAIVARLVRMAHTPPP